MFKNINSYQLKRKTFSVAGVLFRIIVIVAMSYLFLFPLFYMISAALHDPGAIQDPTSMWIPREFSFKSFTTAFKMLEYPKSTAVTALITVFSTIASLISCSLAGYAFARFNFKGKNIAFFFVILMILVPPQILTMPNYLQYRFFDFGGLLSIFKVDINLLNTPWVFILPAFFAAGLKAGLFIFIFRQFFSGLPKELEEAALIDGCGLFGTFIKIMAPLATGAYLSVLLFSVIWHWNEYYSASMYFLEGSKPIMVILSNLSSLLQAGGLITGANNIAESRMYLQAGAFLSILPPLVLYIFTQKYFTESIERTGIVG